MVVVVAVGQLGQRQHLEVGGWCHQRSGSVETSLGTPCGLGQKRKDCCSEVEIPKIGGGIGSRVKFRLGQQSPRVFSKVRSNEVTFDQPINGRVDQRFEIEEVCVATLKHFQLLPGLPFPSSWHLNNGLNRTLEKRGCIQVWLHELCAHVRQKPREPVSSSGSTGSRSRPMLAKENCCRRWSQLMWYV